MTRISQGDDLLHYAYEVGGRHYSWNVRASTLPVAEGATFPLTYVPDDPAMNRPGFPYSAERRAADDPRGIRYGVPIGFFAFFAGASALCHRALVRGRTGESAASRPAPSPAQLARRLALVLTVIFYATLIGSTQATDSLSVFQKLWGEAPLGVPLRLAVGLAATVAYAPLVLLLPHLLPFMTGGDELSFVLRLYAAPPERRRSRNLALLGIVYFFVLLFGWIAYAAHRGV